MGYPHYRMSSCQMVRLLKVAVLRMTTTTSKTASMGRTCKAVQKTELIFLKKCCD